MSQFLRENLTYHKQVNVCVLYSVYSIYKRFMIYVCEGVISLTMIVL